jgi:hypothetical protein
VARDLQAVCLRCLRKRPEERYATAADLAADLRRFLDGYAVTAEDYGGSGQPPAGVEGPPGDALLTADEGPARRAEGATTRSWWQFWRR